MSVPLTGYGWFWYLGLWIFLWVMDRFGTVFKYRNLDHVLYLTSNLWSKLLKCRQNTRSLFDAKNSLSDAKVSHELGTLLDSA